MSKTQQNNKQGGSPPTSEQIKLNPNVIVKVVSAQQYQSKQSKGELDHFIKLKQGNFEYLTAPGLNQGQNLIKWGDDQTYGFYYTKEEKLVCELWDDDYSSQKEDQIGTVEILMKDLIANKNQQGDKKYVATRQGQNVADIILNIKYDSNVQIDAQKNQQQLADAQQKSKQISEQNKALRKNHQMERHHDEEQISQSRVVNNSQLENRNSPNIVVQVLSANILYNFEEEKGKMDPYFIMKMGNQQFQTTTAKDMGQNPKWTEGAKYGFVRTNESKITLELWEDDEQSADDYLGLAQIDINELLSKKPQENKYTISDKNGKNIGEVQLLIQINMNTIDNKSQKNVSQVGQTNLANSKQFSLQPLTGLGIQKMDASRSISKEELQQKTKEIQDRLNNIQVKLRPQPLVTYIEDNVHKALLEGMKKLAKERPTNPIRELGMFLINYNESSHHQNQPNQSKNHQKQHNNQDHQNDSDSDHHSGNQQQHDNQNQQNQKKH